MKIYLLKKLVLVLLLILISLNLKSQTFTDSGISLPELANGSVAWGDYNNDENPDILVCGFDNSSQMIVKVILNNGNLTFSDPGVTFSPLIPANVGYVYKSNCEARWSDFDNDGNVDILFNGPSSSEGHNLLVYRNQGNGTFLLKTTFSYSNTVLGKNSLDLGDFDNDGDQDILLVTTNVTRILQNQGNFNFKDINNAHLAGFSLSSSTWGDYDNDGDLDILLTGQSDLGYNSFIYRNAGNNSFEKQTNISLRFTLNGAGEWGDFDNDGLLDILLTGNYNSSIYKNNGNNSFSEITGLNLPNYSESRGKWGDLDNDGDMDIILTGKINASYVTKIFLNNGNNSFTEETGETISGVYENYIDLGDYDNDGDLDILITGNTGSARICKLYRNGSTLSNPKPGKPILLTASMQGSDMILKWNQVKTDNTSAGAISYNVMVGTTSGGIELISPHSSTSTGARKISGMGNGQLDTVFVLRNIKKGNYYWKVQAIDNSFKGGMFSDLSSFNYTASFQAYGLNISNNGGKESTLSWSRGNGDNCIVFMKEGSTGTAMPQNGTIYTPSSIFKSGTQISSTDWYCVYKGTGTSVRVTGLNANANYIFQVMEYTGAQIYDTQTAQNNPLTFKTGIFTELVNANLQPINKPRYIGFRGTTSWIDIDSDLDLDLYLLSLYGTYIYKNDGNDVFTQVSTTLPTGYSAAWGDYNKDDFPDVIVSEGSSTKVFKNNESFSFTNQSGINIISAEFSTETWIDYDNDGDLDIVINGRNSTEGGITKIYKNNGNNTFTDQLLINLEPFDNASQEWGDYDNDGYADAIFSGTARDATYKTKVFRNNGSNNFTEQTEISLPGNTGGVIDFGDYDNDGDFDIFFSGNTNRIGVISRIYQNNSNNSFTELTGLNIIGLTYSSGGWGDYDNDGDLDILLTGMTTGYVPVSKLYRNNGNNLFTEDTESTFPPIGSGTAKWGDYDNDGDLDILLTGNTYDGSFSKIFRNDINTPNLKPDAPVNLSSVVNKSDVTLKWNSVRTDLTPYKSITYNIKAGTTNGAINTVAPQSSDTGKRRLVDLGNAFLDTTYYLKNLSFGTYFWSVQAIDNGYAGGSFSETASFTIVPVQASNLSAEIVDNNSLNLKWERGNGDRCIVFCKQASTGTASPDNNTGYLADSEFGFGSQIRSTGWYCVYDGRNDSVIVKGLVYKADYSFHVIEYMGSLNSEQYFTDLVNGNPGVFSTSLFSDQTAIALAESNCNPVVWGDYDNDGFLDILLPGMTSYIFHNNKDNTFSILNNTSLPGVNFGSAAWGDYDNDEDLDIVITGATTLYGMNPVSKLFKNEGNGIFTEQTQIFTPVQYSSVSWGDYNNDGFLDLLLAGATGNDPNYNPVTKIYKNDGNGSFIEQSQISLTGIYHGSASWGDYDNDGDLDIFIGGNNQNNPPFYEGPAKIYRNNGDNTFTEQNQIQFNVVRQSSGRWGDFDKDGDLDLLVTSLGQLWVYKNGGNNTFSTLMQQNFGFFNTCYAEWADFDSDGYLDILFTNANYTSKIYRNINGTSFIDQNEKSLLNAGYSFASTADYDNDGDPDILYAKMYGSTDLYRNNTIMKSGLFKTNSPPSIPLRLTAEYFPAGIFLKWNSVKNDETPWRSMTYNISIGTQANNSNITPPHSDNTGYRRIVSMGNAQTDTTFLIKGFSSGTYYWKVQATDQGYMGGEWSDVASFEVKNVQSFFTSDQVCLGYTTNFTDQSVATAGIASWKWDFNDGIFSTVQNPSHKYSASGTYNVKLVVTDTQGAKDSLINIVTVKAKPQTDYLAPSVCQGSATTFSNTTLTNGLTVSSWYWDFGDGQTSILQQPAAHGYLGAADYTVQLKALASNGCRDSVTKTVTVGAYPVAAVTANAPLTFCKGDSVTFSVPYNAEYLYKWKIDAVDMTGADSSRFVAKLTGNYSAEVVNSKGNCKTVSTPVTVSALNSPAAPLISASGNLTLCQGDSVVLSVTNEPGYSYIWKLNGGAVGTNASQYVAKNNGVFTLSVANSNGCSVNSSNSVTLTVNSLPVVGALGLEGKKKFCAGESAILSVPLTSGYIYSWKNSDGLIGGATSNSYSVTSSGEYSLDVSNSSGCKVTTEAITIVVGEKPLMPRIDKGSYTKGTCLGESPLRLSVDDIVEEYNYRWYRNGTPLSSSTFIEITEEGNYYLEASRDICSSERDSINIDFKETLPKPVLNAKGPSVWYLSTSSDANYYKWYYNGASIPGADNKIFVAGQNLGIYRVSISDDNICFAFSDTIRIPSGAVGIETPDPFADVKIYPNPTTGLFTIEMDNNIFGDLFIDIFSPNGSKTLSIKFDKSTEYFSSEIDLSGQAEGMYLINLSLDKFRAVRKVLVE